MRYTQVGYTSGNIRWTKVVGNVAGVAVTGIDAMVIRLELGQFYVAFGRIRVEMQRPTAIPLSSGRPKCL